MVDFRSKAEQEQERYQQAVVHQDYKRAFEKSQSQAVALIARIESLEAENKSLRHDLNQLAELHQSSIHELRSNIESGLNQLNDDNKRLHTMIQSGQSQDAQLIQQMDQNHRERMSGLLQILDKQSGDNG